MKPTRLALSLLGACLASGASHGEPAALRIVAFNVGDVRAEHVAKPDEPRLRAIAAILQELRPDIVLLSEVQYDEPNGATARRFAEEFLATPQTVNGVTLEPLAMRVFAAPSNTGVHSGHDLDRNGQVDPASKGRVYGGDCWGYGEFAGQYGMALLVGEGIEIDLERVRTFRDLPWAAVPEACMPVVPESGEPWYDADVASRFPLSSKSHWDVPVRLPDGSTLHVLCSHPTPPVFDGPEDRNGRRNHDEIRFWAEYLDGAGWIVDDRGGRGGLGPADRFVIMGDLNADPADGDSRENPVGRLILAHPRVNATANPASELAWPGLDATDTAAFRLRVDYVLPSSELTIESSRVARWPAGVEGPSDHFPVVVDVRMPR